jgi:tryptophanyl-tRNA synthetase
MSLQDATKKMSKSDENEKNFVSIIDSPKKIGKKIKSAQTDSDTVVSYDPENKAGLSNLLTIYSVLSEKPVEKIVQDYQGKMYGHLKADLAELVIETLAPIQSSYHDYMKNKDYLEQLMKKGALKARARAQQTLKKVYETTGLIYRS